MYLMGIGVVQGGGPRYSILLEYDTVCLPVFRRNLLSVFRAGENRASRLLENIDSHQTTRRHNSVDLLVYKSQQDAKMNIKRTLNLCILLGFIY
jgi:hypothetical protein